MKHIISLILLIALSLTSAGAFKYMNVDTNNGLTENIEISSIKNIVFNDSKMQINFNQGGSNSFILYDIRKIGFDNLSNIKNQVEKKKLTVYPNPVSDVLYIVNDDRSEMRIELFSLDGKKIIEVISTDAVKNLDVSTLNKGLYLLKAGNRSFKISKR